MIISNTSFLSVYYYNIYLGEDMFQKIQPSPNLKIFWEKMNRPIKTGVCEHLAFNFAVQHYLFEMFLMFCLLDLRSKHMIIHSSNSWRLSTWLILTNKITASSDCKMDTILGTHYFAKQNIKVKAKW